MTLRDHPETLTHWIVTPDGFGGNSFSAPALIKGRWENKSQLIRKEVGEGLFSEAIVYVDTDVKVGDYLSQGDQTLVADPTSLSNAHQVQQFDKIPGLRMLDFDRKAIL